MISKASSRANRKHRPTFLTATKKALNPHRARNASSRDHEEAPRVRSRPLGGSRCGFTVARFNIGVFTGAFRRVQGRRLLLADRRCPFEVRHFGVNKVVQSACLRSSPVIAAGRDGPASTVEGFRLEQRIQGNQRVGDDGPKRPVISAGRRRSTINGRAGREPPTCSRFRARRPVWAIASNW